MQDIILQVLVDLVPFTASSAGAGPLQKERLDAKTLREWLKVEEDAYANLPELTSARLKSKSFRSGERKPEDKVITPKMADIMLETELMIL